MTKSQMVVEPAAGGISEVMDVIQKTDPTISPRKMADNDYEAYIEARKELWKIAQSIKR